MDHTLLPDDIPDGYVLDSVYDIEHVLGMLKEATDKVDWYKGVKSHRAKQVDKTVASLQDYSNRLRGVVLRTMKHFAPDKKTLPFPGVGKVTCRAAKVDYVVDDQDAMLSFFDEKGVKDQVVEVIEKVNIREAKKILADFDTMGQNVPGTAKKPGVESISITYEKPKPEESKTFPAPVIVPSHVDTVDLDTLEV